MKPQEPIKIVKKKRVVIQDISKDAITELKLRIQLKGIDKPAGLAAFFPKDLSIQSLTNFFHTEC